MSAFNDRRRMLQAKARNRNLPVYPGTPAHPQGRLLSFSEGGRAPLLDARFKEAARRRQAGEPNPSHRWDPPMLQYHFQERWDARTGRLVPPPVQQELKLL